MGKIEVVKYLVKQVTDIHAFDDFALRFSTQNDRYEILNIYWNMVLNAKGNQAQRKSAESGHIEKSNIW